MLSYQVGVFTFSMTPEDRRAGVIKPLFELRFPKEPITCIFISFFKGRIMFLFEIDCAYPMHKAFSLFLCCFPNEL